MEKYSKLKEDEVFKFTKYWVTCVRESVRSAAPYMSLLEGSEGVLEGDMVGDLNTIISIIVKIRNSKVLDPTVFRQLTFKELKIFHLKMTLSIPLPPSCRITPNSSDQECLESERIGKALGTRIMLGQPVALGDPRSGSADECGVGAVVRIALGATMVISALTALDDAVDKTKKNSVERMREEDARVIQKMIFLSKYWDEIVTPVPVSSPVSVPVSVPVPVPITEPVSASVSGPPIGCPMSGSIGTRHCRLSSL